MLGLIGMDAADLLVLDDDLSLKQVGVALTPKAQSKLESRDFFESENRSTFGPN